LRKNPSLVSMRVMTLVDRSAVTSSLRHKVRYGIPLIVIYVLLLLLISNCIILSVSCLSASSIICHQWIEVIRRNIPLHHLYPFISCILVSRPCFSILAISPCRNLIPELLAVFGVLDLGLFKRTKFTGLHTFGHTF